MDPFQIKANKVASSKARNDQIRSKGVGPPQYSGNCPDCNTPVEIEIEYGVELKFRRCRECRHNLEKQQKCWRTEDNWLYF
jgi:NMD protein affecting ribosome stability and mRNA decay